VARDPYRRERKLARALGGPVAGIDEVGRGPWAGPVVAAAVVLPAGRRIAGLADSKTLDEAERDRLCAEILAVADVGVGWATTRAVDRFNVREATHRAMRRAVAHLRTRPVHLLVDGREVPDLPVPHTALVKGDARCACISAASIVAKVVRDRFMTRTASRYPEYGFEKHKGYGTPEHREALARSGPCALHRASFAPVALTRQGALF
jgi:ribonuclease HII